MATTELQRAQRAQASAAKAAREAAGPSAYGNDPGQGDAAQQARSDYAEATGRVRRAAFTQSIRDAAEPQHAFPADQVSWA